MSEADRLRVRDILHRLGYYKGHVDGVFGPLTRAAINEAQIVLVGLSGDPL